MSNWVSEDERSIIYIYICMYINHQSICFLEAPYFSILKDFSMPINIVSTIPVVSPLDNCGGFPPVWLRRWDSKLRPA